MKDKVAKQVEFYFSDSNLPRDKFMLERVHDDPEGYVDLGLIATFARMRDILKARHGGCTLRALRARAQALHGGANSCTQRRAARPGNHSAA